MTPERQPVRFATARRILCLAVAYYVSGKLGLLLAIPPGYATAFWPPSGIALTAVLLFGHHLWPGVALGSFAVNLATSLDLSTGWAAAHSIMLCLAIAGGAAFQAVAGAFLARRYVGLPLELVELRDVTKFFLLAGPVSCLINATIGVGALLTAGSIRPEQVPYSWWTWWVGDSIGVVVMSPLLLVWWGHPRAVWRRRAATVAVPLAGALALIVTAFVLVSSLERARIRAEFEQEAEKITASVQTNFANAIRVVHSVRDFLVATPEADRASVFSSFVRGTLAINPSIRAVSWDPVVDGSDRQRFERAARDSGYDQYRIFERSPEGAPVSSRLRDQYVPVLHIEPAESNIVARGYDVASERFRLDALQRACKTGTAAATALIRLVQQTSDGASINVYLPVYTEDSTRRRLHQRCHFIRGFATGVLQLADVMEAALKVGQSPDVAVELTDQTTPGGATILWSSVRAPSKTGIARENVSPSSADELTYSVPIQVAGRLWSVTSTAGPGYVRATGTLTPWITLAGGMLSMALLGAFLLVVSGNAVTIERLGAERAAELSHANETLQREIIERQQAEQALRENETQLRQAQKMEAVGQLAGGVAHDFNNLLTAILGYGTIVRSSVGPDSAIGRDVDEILKAGGKACRLTQQLLAFSRKQVLQPKVINLNRIVCDMEGMLRRLVREDIEIFLSLQEDLGSTMADPSQIEQVVMNLAVNASDAMPNGGQLKLETSNVILKDSVRGAEGLRPGVYVTLTVSDTGIGMDEQTRSHVFEPFFTTKERGKGTGLGLSTVYGIVQQSLGGISLQTEPGHGSTFTLYFPRSEDISQEPRLAKTFPAVRGGHETVLLVEDEEALRELSARILRNAGYRVIAAADGEDALDRARDHSGAIDLLVTDIVMPKVGGFELAQRLQPAHPETKVMYMSGYSELAIQDRGALGAQTTLVSKPFAPKELLQQVRTRLDSSTPIASA